VLKVLEEQRIPVHAIAGISAGSIIGAAYAGGAGVACMIEGARGVKFRDFGGWTLSRMGLASNERMEKFLARSLPAATFEQLKIPFAVIATDLLTGEPAVFRRGGLIGPVRASCTYPGLFLPMQLNGRTLIDGAFSCPMPVEVLRQMGATHIIAVHAGGANGHQLPGNLFQMVNQCFALLQKHVGGDWRKQADAVIEPDLTGIAWDGFDQFDRLVAGGEAAARAALPQIRGWLRPQPSAAPGRTASLARA
jgi:NTE family protein